MSQCEHHRKFRIDNSKYRTNNASGRESAEKRAIMTCLDCGKLLVVWDGENYLTVPA